MACTTVKTMSKWEFTLLISQLMKLMLSYLPEKYVKEVTEKVIFFKNVCKHIQISVTLMELEDKGPFRMQHQLRSESHILYTHIHSHSLPNNFFYMW